MSDTPKTIIGPVGPPPAPRMAPGFGPGTQTPEYREQTLAIRADKHAARMRAAALRQEKVAASVNTSRALAEEKLALARALREKAETEAALTKRRLEALEHAANAWDAAGTIGEQGFKEMIGAILSDEALPWDERIARANQVQDIASRARLLAIVAVRTDASDVTPAQQIMAARTLAQMSGTIQAPKRNEKVGALNPEADMGRLLKDGGDGEEEDGEEET